MNCNSRHLFQDSIQKTFKNSDTTRPVCRKNDQRKLLITLFEPQA